MSIAVAMFAHTPDLADYEPLEARLIAEFSPPLRPEEVQRCLVGCIAAFQSATVRTFLPLLIEREARDRLRLLTSSRVTPVRPPSQIETTTPNGGERLDAAS